MALPWCAVSGGLCGVFASVDQKDSKVSGSPGTAVGSALETKAEMLSQHSRKPWPSTQSPTAAPGEGGKNT